MIIGQRSPQGNWLTEGKQRSGNDYSSSGYSFWVAVVALDMSATMSII